MSSNAERSGPGPAGPADAREAPAASPSDATGPRPGVRLVPELANRTSGRAYAATPVPERSLLAVLEAARWAPSAANAQPWRFLLARSEDSEAFGTLLACLSHGNQWAASAPVLMITLADTRFPRTDGVNPHAWHDVGIAVGMMAVQAAAEGLMLHAMGNVLADRVRDRYGVPDDVEPVGAVALGYPGDPASLPDDLRRKETRPRRRRPLEQTVFAGRYGEPVPWAPRAVDGASGGGGEEG